jgi:hypothetical protein
MGEPLPADFPDIGAGDVAPAQLDRSGVNAPKAGDRLDSPIQVMVYRLIEIELKSLSKAI